MNVTFHTLTALATAAVLSSTKAGRPRRESSAPSPMPGLAVGFVAGILVHGLLDFVPHSYPIKSIPDVVLSLALFVAALAFAKPQYRLLIASCFLGSILPDLVDLAPAIMNKRLGCSLPVIKIFPWHWHQYSGSIYNGNRVWASVSYHVVVVSLSASLLYAYRKSLFGQGTDRIPSVDRIDS